MTVGALAVGAVLAGTGAVVDDDGAAGAEEPAEEPEPEFEEVCGEEECEAESPELPWDREEAAVELGVGTVAGTLTAEGEVLAPEDPSLPVAPVPLPEESFFASAATLACVSFSLWPASAEVSRPPPEMWTVACF